MSFNSGFKGLSMLVRYGKPLLPVSAVLLYQKWLIL